MDLSIIILNYKQKGLVKQCVKGIVNSQPRLRYELIIVDNNSQDGCLEMVSRLFIKEAEPKPAGLMPAERLAIPPIITIQSGANNGFPAGNNLGMAKARGKYIVILNPDIAVFSGALEKMFAFMESNSAIGIIGPKLINPDGSVQYSCRRFPNSLIPLYRRTFFGKLPFAKKAIDHYLMRDFSHDAILEVDWLFGSCLMIRQSVLEKVGNFDERFFMYFEDLDLCRRAWAQGFKVVFLPAVTLVHYHQRFSAERGGVLGIFSKGGRIHLASGFKYFLKYLGTPPPVRN